jgi:outer membrane lipoprotein SlyB
MMRLIPKVVYWRWYGGPTLTRENVLIIAQVAVAGILGACVIMGHNSAITDALIAISGSVAGTGVYEKLKAK